MFARGVFQPAAHDLLLRVREFVRSADDRLGGQCAHAAVPNNRNPTAHTGGMDLEDFGNILGGESFPDTLDSQLAPMLQFQR